MPTRPRPLRILLRAADRRVRLVFMVLTLVGCSVGFLRAAFPGRAHSAVMRTLSPESTPDDSGAVTERAPLPRSGLRRAALTLGPALPNAIHDAGEYAESPGIAIARAIVPGSFIPNPPFHPPRSV